MKKILNKIKESAAEFIYRLKFIYYLAKSKTREWRGGFVAQIQQQQQTETWPPVSGTTTGFVVKGKTTIQWGTNGLLSSPYPGSGGGFYTVTKYNEKPILDRTKLPNGNGVTTSDVMITDGISFELTVRDDSSMTPPAINATVSIVDAAGLLGTAGLVYTARVLDHNYDTALKQAGERVLMCENLLLIDSQTGSAQTGR